MNFVSREWLEHTLLPTVVEINLKIKKIEFRVKRWKYAKITHLHLGYILSTGQEHIVKLIPFTSTKPDKVRCDSDFDSPRHWLICYGMCLCFSLNAPMKNISERLCNNTASIQWIFCFHPELIFLLCFINECVKMQRA